MLFQRGDQVQQVFVLVWQILVEYVMLLLLVFYLMESLHYLDWMEICGQDNY